MIEINSVNYGCGLKIMDKIETGTIDMICADLPYGTTQNKWDKIIDYDQLWSRYNRIIKDNGAIVLTAQSPFDKTLANSNIKYFRYEWIWVKNVATGHLNVRWMPMKGHENILVFYKKPPKYNPQYSKGDSYISNRNNKTEGGKNYNNIIRTDTVNEGKRHPKTVLKFDRETGHHPNQKPVPLIEYLIKTYTDEGQTVLDNTAGSMTTGIACINTNRNYILMENDPEIYEKGFTRLQSHIDSRSRNVAEAFSL